MCFLYNDVYYQNIYSDLHMLNILLMIFLRSEIIISTTQCIIYSDCNLSLLAVLSSGIVSSCALYAIDIRTVPLLTMM